MRSADGNGHAADGRRLPRFAGPAREKRENEQTILYEGALVTVKEKRRIRRGRGAAGRILRLGTPWPFPEERARDFLAGLAEVLVLDEERDRLLNAVYAVKGKYDLRIKVVPFYGEESSERDLRGSLVRFFGKDAEEQILRIGAPAERSLLGMPMLPPVLQPERAACWQGGD